jgi:integrase/recombinase XerD
MKTFLYSKVVEGFLLSANARHLSPHTINDYTRALTKFAVFLDGDLPVHQITHHHIEKFILSQTKLSNKSLLNLYIGLSALWTWMVNEEIVPANVVRKMTPPKVEKKDITPLTQEELKAMVSVLNKSKLYIKQGRTLDHALASSDRNRAIILLMLDTGVRAQELCDLKIEDVDNRNNRIFVRMGKGMKERMLPFSPRTGQMIWRYLAQRKDSRPDEPLFLSKINRPMTRTKLAEMFRSVGNRAGVKNVHPHRLRHTFAIQYLRNGGNAYTLQMMLGHSTLETVKLYLKLAQVDIDVMHRRASPVDNWRL